MVSLSTSEIFVATRSRTTLLLIQRFSQSQKSSVKLIEPTEDSILSAASKPNQMVVVDITQDKARFLEFVPLVVAKQPSAKIVIFGDSPDVALAAKAVVAGASCYLFPSMSAEELSAAFKDVWEGKTSCANNFFGRVRSGIPGPPNSEGTCRLFSGVECSFDNAVQRCVRLGLSEEEIARHLNVSNEYLRTFLNADRVSINPGDAPKDRESVATPRSRFFLGRNTVIVGGVVIFLGVFFSMPAHGPRRYQLEGSVTFNGSPLRDGTINFRPVKGSPGPSAGGEIRDGLFSIPASGGTFAGIFRVEITASKPGKALVPTGDGKMVFAYEQFVPERYNDESELTVNVGASSSNVFEFSLRSAE